MPNGHDKNFVRLCAALEGFQVRYGQWPTRVRIFQSTLENLRSLFTAEDFDRLQSKVQLIADEAPFIAEDDDGQSYSYGAEGFPARRAAVRASTWLEVSPIAKHDLS